MDNEQHYNRLKAKLRINMNQLDQELIELAPDTQSVAEYCAEAIQLRDAAKGDVDNAKAHAANVLRNGADKKPTEAQIATDVLLQDSVIEAQTSFDTLKYDAALWQALVGSFGEKGSALRRICEMIMAGYITATSVNEGNRAALNKAREETKLRTRSSS